LEERQEAHRLMNKHTEAQRVEHAKKLKTRPQCRGSACKRSMM
jgi:hypothetical protein